MTRLVACGLILLIGVIGILGHRMTNHKAKDGAKLLPCVDCRDYVEATAEDKLKVLWTKIKSDEYTGVLPSDKEVTKAEHWWERDFAKGMHDFLHTNHTNNLPTKKWFTTVPDFMKKTKEQKAQAANGTMPYVFDRFSDENPEEHTKIIHTYGAVAKVRLVPLDNNLGLTGFFKEGGESGVIRLSMPGAIEGICKPPYDLTRCLKTSLALKMLRNGDFSSNIFAQTNLGDGVGADFNFFKWNQGSWLPVPGGPLAPIIVDLFNKAATPSNAVGNTEFASEGSKKNQTKGDITAPKLVYFIPNADISKTITSDWHDPRDDFKKIKAGTLLYTIVVPVDDGKKCTADNAGGFVAPIDLNETNCERDAVAEVFTASEFVTSAYGDSRLFFQHERVDPGGKWKRKSCVTKTSDGGVMRADDLPAKSEYRMPDDFSRTCTQECHAGTTEDLGNPKPCPFYKLETEGNEKAEREAKDETEKEA